MDHPKVIIFSAFLSPFRSGAEACAEEVALRLVDQYDITIITARMRMDLPREDLLRGMVPVIRVGLGFKFDKWLYPFLAPRAAKRLAGKGEGVILHAILETFAGLALHRCRKMLPNARRLLTLQTTNRKLYRKKIVRSAQTVTAISTALQKAAEAVRGTGVTLIPNGIDLAAAPSVPKISGRMLFVGRLEPMKGVDILLKAFAEMLHDVREKDRGGLYLRIVGEGSQRKKLEKLASALGITDCVKFVGQLSHEEVYVEYGKAVIFCGLSRSEALGNVFLEAQACGCAVIGTKVGGIPDIVEDGKTGLLIPPDDIPSAVSALRRLLKDASLRERLALQGREHAKEYDWNIISGRYAEIYEEITDRSEN